MGQMSSNEGSKNGHVIDVFYFGHPSSHLMFLMCEVIGVKLGTTQNICEKERESVDKSYGTLLQSHIRHSLTKSSAAP